MKLAKIKVERESHGALLEMYCPECNGITPIRLDLLSIRNVSRSYQNTAILQGKCPKCKQKWKAVVRLN